MVTDDPVNLRIIESGEGALVVEFGDRIDPEINRRVVEMDVALRDRSLRGIIETLPSYRSLLVILDPLVVDIDALKGTLCDLAGNLKVRPEARRKWRVPVVFGGERGVDLEFVADLHGVSCAKLVELHVNAAYTVYMTGFVPGFSYLGGLPETLATPRRPVPRPSVPPSSISIGGAQCAVGSISAPSGWHLIGQTPVRPYMAKRDPKFLFQPGDEIAFFPIPESDWSTLHTAAEAGELVSELVDQ